MRIPTLRVARITGLLVLLGLAGLTVAFAATGTFPLTPTHNSTAARAFGLRAGGSLSITNSLSGQAILTAAGMRPGEARIGQVTITNSGNIAGDFTLTQTGVTDTGSATPFSTVAQLVIQDITDPSAPLTIYAGPLGSLPATALGSFDAGDTRVYRFTATFPNGTAAHDNPLQGAKTTVEYDWSATAPDSTQPTDTTPATTTAPTTGVEVTPIPIPGHHVQRNPRWKVSLTAPLRRKLRSGRIDFIVSCGPRCSVSFGGAIRIPPIRRTFKVTHVSFTIPAGYKVRVEVKLSSALKAGLLRALRAHKHPTVTATVRARSGKLKATAKRTVRFVR
jgi:spore coat-associated protein N